MKDIKPDTSLYPRWSAEWLKAALLVREGTSRGELYEWNYKGEGWICHPDFTLGSFHEAHEYRLKPKSRELWAVYHGGTVSTFLDSASADRHFSHIRKFAHGAKAELVRFVEQPE